MSAPPSLPTRLPVCAAPIRRRIGDSGMCAAVAENRLKLLRPCAVRAPPPPFPAAAVSPATAQSSSIALRPLSPPPLPPRLLPHAPRPPLPPPPSAPRSSRVSAAALERPVYVVTAKRRSAARAERRKMTSDQRWKKENWMSPTARVMLRARGGGGVRGGREGGSYACGEVVAAPAPRLLTPGST